MIHQMAIERFGHPDLAGKSTVRAQASGIFVGDLDVSDGEGVIAGIRPVPPDLPLASEQTVDLLAHEVGRAARSVGHGLIPEPAHPLGEVAAQINITRALRDGLGKQINQRDSRIGSVRNSQATEDGLSVHRLKNRLGIDGESIPAVFA